MQTRREQREAEYVGIWRKLAIFTKGRDKSEIKLNSEHKGKCKNEILVEMQEEQKDNMNAIHKKTTSKELLQSLELATSKKKV